MTISSGSLHRGRGVREFSLGAARILRRGVRFDGVCVLTMDPATRLPTGEVVENGLPAAAMRGMAEIEMRGGDFNSFASLSRSGRLAASLSEATGGDLDRSGAIASCAAQRVRRRAARRARRRRRRRGAR